MNSYFLKILFTKLVEVYEFRILYRFLWFTKIIGGDLIDNDAVIVNLTQLIQISQVVEAHFVIVRNEKVPHFAAYTRPYIGKSSIQVHKNYIVVEDEQIHDQQA